MHIKIDNLRGPEIFSLLQEHLHSMALHSPPESMHALDLDALRQPDIRFWTAWDKDGDGAELLGCCALKELDAQHGEIKSMRTASQHLRKGVARALLQHLLDEAGHRSYRRLSLETGSMAAFEPARLLYASMGFVDSAPFADYAIDPYSVFMTKIL